jgi:F420-non-reducing hydrogenase small subunit
MKLRIAVEGLGACAGCEIAILDLHEEIVSILQDLEIDYAPILMDKKSLSDNVDVLLLSGSVRNKHDAEKAARLSEKAKITIAFGSCASFGGVPGLANLYTTKELLERVYLTTESTDNKERVLPSEEIPPLEQVIKPLKEWIKINCNIPGCPPQPKLIKEMFQMLLNGKPVTLSKKTVCDECDLKREEKKITKILRWGQGEPDSSRCLLEQGYFCAGPATRAGCGAKCLVALVPCRGCMGPPENVIDQGARIASAIASVAAIDEKNRVDPEQLAAMIKDVVGSFYRFTLPSSIISRKVSERKSR